MRVCSDYLRGALMYACQEKGQDYFEMIDVWNAASAAYTTISMQ